MRTLAVRSRLPSEDGHTGRGRFHQPGLRGNVKETGQKSVHHEGSPISRFDVSALRRKG